MPLAPGSNVETSRDRYEIERVLFEGGMGRILAARGSSGRRVVVKEPRFRERDERDNRIRREKLKVEAEILSAIRHRNVVEYVDSVDRGETFYLVLEYIDGKDMRTKFWKRPPPEPLAKKYILQVLGALRYLHRKNIIHRDVNPKNILVGSVVKMIDFGAAKRGYTQILPLEHTIIGTPGWSAPEQFSGVTTPQCDIYGAGATLFFLLTGEPPALQPGSETAEKKHRKILEKTSDKLLKVALKALSLDPRDRYRLAEEMSADISGRSVSAVPSVVCMGKRHPISGSLAIGRSELCDLAVEDPARYLSRRHAVIYERGGAFWVVDSNSVNGTFIHRDDGFRRISRAKLRRGDLIALCHRSGKGPYVTLRADIP